ncbi:peptide/nickel transport system permease protein [Psychroflexus salarius]|uniref:Peptide/nickel transport system permease protein n=1 Tax=Psychroflexus salarius TaxID=1155689 RepID=A0A1M4SA41_9FLAO|nr:ABC transporter permease [Psychroflexus salarius]SHE28917.1 peptide/nickel transport system permease protein [Psychroflexus salarius]
MQKLLSKIGYAFFTLFGVVSVVFLLFNVLPGDPTKMMLGENQTQAQVDLLRVKYGFDQPVYKQYLYYLNDLSPISLHSTHTKNFTSLKDKPISYTTIFKTEELQLVIKFPYLRRSFQKQNKAVSEIIGETLPNTAILAISAISIALIIGLILGILSAIYQDSWLDKFIQVVSTLGMSVPSFFSAILFAWLFGFVLHEYTNLNMTGNLYELDDFGEQKNLVLKNLLLPAVVLGIRPLAVVIQLMRNSILEELSKDYVVTAKAKGLKLKQIIIKHVFKNALNPVITAISGWFASMLAGAVFVEYIFGWNGLGKEIVNALNTLDLPVIMGSVLIIATIFIVINILVDVIYSILDPKVN